MIRTGLVRLDSALLDLLASLRLGSFRTWEFNHQAVLPATVFMIMPAAPYPREGASSRLRGSEWIYNHRWDVLLYMSEERAQRLVQQLQMLERHAIDLTQRETNLANIFREAQSAIESVRALGEKDDSDALIPIGMGVFVKSRVSSKDSVVLNVGAGAALEKDRDSALNFLEAKIKEIQVAIRDVSAKRQETVGRLEQGKQEMSKLLQSDSHQHG